VVQPCKDGYFGPGSFLLAFGADGIANSIGKSHGNSPDEKQPGKYSSTAVNQMRKAQR
jgi:hypothetical protein